MKVSVPLTRMLVLCLFAIGETRSNNVSADQITAAANSTDSRPITDVNLSRSVVLERETAWEPRVLNP